MDLITQLQTVVAPDVFKKPIVYDTRKNVFSIVPIAFPGGGNSHEVYPVLSFTNIQADIQFLV